MIFPDEDLCYISSMDKTDDKGFRLIQRNVLVRDLAYFSKGYYCNLSIAYLRNGES